ncbi:MAG: nucleoside-diphosphate kinase [Puniceicoccales bacterium]|jgi:nucleoside-diphosphate kinase|nr:nucleoside-diphosphate kinase [Puniceicoccales bacterium]
MRKQLWIFCHNDVKFIKNVNAQRLILRKKHFCDRGINSSLFAVFLSGDPTCKVVRMEIVMKKLSCIFSLGLALISGCFANQEQEAMEQTVIIFKPDAMRQGRIGAILQRFEERHFHIIGIKMQQLGEDVLREHYSHLVDKPFFGEIVNFMSSSPVIIMVLEGDNVVKRAREMAGETDSRLALKGTIRGDFGMDKSQNMIHASDSVESARMEVMRFFTSQELFRANFHSTE